MYLPHWGKGSRTGQKHPGHWGTALQVDKGQTKAERPAHPCFGAVPSPAGVGKLMPFTMNRSMSLLLKSGKILSVGRETEAGTSAPSCSSHFPQWSREPSRLWGCHSWVQVWNWGFPCLATGFPVQCSCIYLVPTSVCFCIYCVCVYTQVPSPADLPHWPSFASFEHLLCTWQPLSCVLYSMLLESC